MPVEVDETRGKTTWVSKFANLDERTHHLLVKRKIGTAKAQMMMPRPKARALDTRPMVAREIWNGRDDKKGCDDEGAMTSLNDSQSSSRRK